MPSMGCRRRRPEGLGSLNEARRRGLAPDARLRMVSFEC